MFGKLYELYICRLLTHPGRVCLRWAKSDLFLIQCHKFELIIDISVYISSLFLIKPDPGFVPINAYM